LGNKPKSTGRAILAVSAFVQFVVVVVQQIHVMMMLHDSLFRCFFSLWAYQINAVQWRGNWRAKTAIGQKCQQEEEEEGRRGGRRKAKWKKNGQHWKKGEFGQVWGNWQLWNWQQD
jgi:hypothetical protein